MQQPAHGAQHRFLGGADADAECFRDLFVAFSFRNQLHDLPLACAETLAGFGFVASAFGAVEDVRKENLGDFRGKKRLVPSERFNRFHQKMVRFGFRDEALYSGFERVPNQVVALMRGEHEDLRARQFSFDLDGGIEAIELGHGHVENDDVGLEFTRLSDCFAAV